MLSCLLCTYLLTSKFRFHHPMIVIQDDVIKWKHFPRYWPFVQGNSPFLGELPAQRPMTRSFHVFFDLHLYKRLSNQPWCWWFETPSCSLWRHCNGFRHTLTAAIRALLSHEPITSPRIEFISLDNSPASCVFTNSISIDLITTKDRFCLSWILETIRHFCDDCAMNLRNDIPRGLENASYKKYSLKLFSTFGLNTSLALEEIRHVAVFP